jgi:error-prone DNA polymerase
VYGDLDAFERGVEEALGARRAGSPRWRALVELAPEAFGLPRHASQHPGGMVIATEPLIDLCPVQPSAMEGRNLVQWDKDSCADAGFLKIDLLGLGMLSAVERCVDEVARVRGERIDLSRVPFDDREVYETIQRADTTGVFQIESRAQMQTLRRTLPETLDDLTVQVAIIRPGPIIGGAVHPYIERRRLLREDPSYQVPYEHPSLEPVLRDTLGAIVFQDQVLEVAMALAGFSPGEAEGLRRAMSRKRSEAAMQAHRERFIEGAIAKGVEQQVAEQVFEKIQGFSGFGFPKAHAAAFGLLAYQSTWLRVYYGPEFLCALLNEQPMGFYPPDALVHDAQRRGITILPPHINRSGVECNVNEQLAVRIGLGYVLGVKEEEVRQLVEARGKRPFVDAGDLASRSGVGRDTLERLAWAGACDGLSDRRGSLWQLGVAASGHSVPGGVQLTLPLDVPEAPRLRELSDWERLVADYGSFRISIAQHPMELLREDLPEQVVTSRELPRLRDGTRLEVAGLVVARQRPATAKGVTFMLFEDEWGTINLVVPPPVYEQHRLIVRTEPFVHAAGRLEKRGGTINVVVETLRKIERPDLPHARVRHIEPPVGRETGREEDVRPAAATGADLRAVMPAAHSFGRRGR